ncbi:ImmA/IrrE family metallo-endopeptidase [Moraxella nasovis]|uniref:ImmA/IrrE family metallo-endopeptidase n=1 Tax=Moraxella nasovis TaxID=2904121 RepID=UPI001F617FC7|nr:ImmA/IrrE family metallo-endopeptidase [Moraxella nasovis]UNU73369.1 ImmA/IrrE family metallo-endopeptidase [Moraxella nasovis]
MTRAVNYAQSILDSYWDRKLPVIPEQIIDKMRAKMDNPDLLVKIEPMPSDSSGKIEYDRKNSTYVITINSNQHPHRQRFMLAHELGRYVLSNFNELEASKEASAFAAELLMPKAILRHLIFEKDMTDVSVLANAFLGIYS